MAYETDGNIVIGTSVDMYGMNTGLKKIEHSANKLKFTLANVLDLAGGLTLGGIGKAALETASNLQEVQNVVDVAFGDMAWKAEKFAETCIQNFGMSELSAKKTAGSFMAMGRAMDLTLEEASDMAIKLTALTGDFASFYNISQDYARVALSAVYTGETETLKRYGIVLTEANLQQFAYNQGIDTSIKKMSARDKLLLRYMYVLQATSQVEGDFVRTQDTWANQVRVLQERWRQLLITIGNGLITVLTPLLKMLNALISAMISFANTIGRVLSRLFGIKWQNLSGDLTGVGDSADNTGNSLGDLGDDADDAAGGLKKAQKEAKKTLAPFDDLNVLLKKGDESMDDYSGKLGDLAGLGTEDYLGDLVKGKVGNDDSIKDPIIATLFDLGRWLNNKLQELLDSIDWEKIRDKFRHLGHKIADFLNGLISPSLFSKIGTALAQGLNTILELLDGFAERFSWKNFGDSLAAGFTSFFRDFDFELFAKTINDWAHGILETILRFLKNTDWELVGKQIGTLLANIDWLGILKDVLHVVWEALNALSKVFIGMLKKAPIETLIVGAVAGISGLVKLAPKILKLGKAIGLIIDAFRGVSGSAVELAAISPVLGGLGKVGELFATAWSAAAANFQYSMATIGVSTAAAQGSILTFIETFSAGIPLVIKILGTLVVGIGEFFVTMNAFKDLVIDFNEGIDGAFEDVLKNIGILIGAITAAGAALTLLLGFPAGVIAAGLIGLSGAVVGFIKALDEITATNVEEAMQRVVTASENATHTLADYVNNFSGISETSLTGLDKIVESFNKFEQAKSEVQGTIDVIGGIHLAMMSERELTEGEIEKLGEAFGVLKDQMKQYVDAYYDSMIAQANADYAYLNASGKITEAQKQEYADRIQTLYELKEAAEESANTLVDAQQQEFDKLKAIYADENATYEQRMAAQNEYRNSVIASMDLYSNFALSVDEYSQKVEEATLNMDKFRGQLDLSASSLENTTDLSNTVKATLEQLGDTYSNAYDELYTEYQKAEKRIQETQGQEQEAAKEHARVMKERMNDLKTGYIGELEALQADLEKIVPSMMNELGKQWDEMSSFEKWASGAKSRSDFIATQTKNQIKELYGDGLIDTFDEAFGRVGVQGATNAEKVSEEIVDALFKGEVWNGQGEIMYEAATPEIEKALQDTGTFVQTTLDNLNLEGMAQSRAEDVSKGFADGLSDAGSQGVIQSAINTWEEAIVTWIHDGALKFGSPSQTAYDFGVDTVEGFRLGLVSAITGGLVFETITEWMQKCIDTIKNPEMWGGIPTWFLESVITPTLEDFKIFVDTILTDVIPAFNNGWDEGIKKLLDAFKNLGKGLLNTMISVMNKIIESVETGINSIIDGTTEAGGVLGVLAKAAGGMFEMAGISHVKLPRVPALAKGAVIPPNAPFMAMLGDQKRGTNIEAPLDTIKQALADVLGNSSSAASSSVSLNLQVDGQTFARLFLPYSLDELRRRGYNVNVLEA